MIDGLWTVEFSSSIGLFGMGVVVIKDNRVLGGDEGYYYYGNCYLEDSNFHGELTVKRHNRNSISVFGDIEEFSFEFKGTLLQNEFNIAATYGPYSFQSKGIKQVDL